MLFLDFAYRWQKGFQDSASPLMDALIELHGYIVFFLVIILFFVIWMLITSLLYYCGISSYFFNDCYGKLNKYFVDTEEGFTFFVPIGIRLESIGLTRFVQHKIYSRHIPDHFFFYDERLFKSSTLEVKEYKNENKFSNIKNVFSVMKKIISLNKILHNSILEIVWTIIPSIVLIFIAVPSFVLLYSIDEIISPALTLKVIGHQWYWSYEYSDYYLKDLSGEGEAKLNNSLCFDSYMIPEDELEMGDLRLLEVDNPTILPIDLYMRVIVTSSDVLHAWSVPSLGIKIDAVPGRLNQASMFINRVGVFYGQCSEICGVYHGFMPIIVEGVNVDTFLVWLTKGLIEELC